MSLPGQAPAAPLAAIDVSFDATLSLDGLLLSWQAIGVALAIMVALLLALLLRHLAARRAPDDADLRLDELVLIVLGTVPGAVVGGRLVHALAFWDGYTRQPEALLDPQLGSMSLLGAVVGGALSGALAAALLGAPARRWADIAAGPLLLAVAIGKVAQFLGGSGQGLPSDLPWAVAFVGGGPWVGREVGIPSHPAQLYEAAWAVLGIGALVLVANLRRRRRPLAGGVPGLAAIGWIALGRLLAGFVFRDEPLIGALNGEQIAAAAVLVGGAAVAVFVAARRPPAAVPAG